MYSSTNLYYCTYLYYTWQAAGVISDLRYLRIQHVHKHTYVMELVKSVGAVKPPASVRFERNVFSPLENRVSAGLFRRTWDAGF